MFVADRSLVMKYFVGKFMRKVEDLIKANEIRGHQFIELNVHNISQFSPQKFGVAGTHVCY